MTRDPTVHIWTEAPLQGWRALSDSLTALDLWSPEETRTCESPDSSSVVLVELDNSTAVTHLDNQGGASYRSLICLTAHILFRCDDRGILLRARHISGVRNVLADSEREDGWTHNSRVFPCPLSCGVSRLFTCLPHAMAISWAGMRWYTYPLLALLPLVVWMIGDTSARWAHRSSVARCSLGCSASSTPGRLPSPTSSAYSPVNARSAFRRDPSNLRLHAWRLSGKPSVNRAFQEVADKAAHPQGVHPTHLYVQIEYIVSRCSYGRWIPSRPLWLL